MVQGKKQLNSKPKFAEVVIGDYEVKVNNKKNDMSELQKIGKSASFVEKYAKLLVTCTFQKCRFDTDTERLIHGMVMGKNSYLFCRDLNTCK